MGIFGDGKWCGGASAAVVSRWLPLLGACVFAIIVAACGSGGNDNSSSATFSDVTFGNAQFVAVGREGRIHTSPSGTSFDKQPSPIAEESTSPTLNGVTEGAALLVIVGDAGTILTSRDGTTWTVETIATLVSLQGVIFGNGRFVAVGYDGTIATSSDGRA